jgi:hypothetical protein
MPAAPRSLYCRDNSFYLLEAQDEGVFELQPMTGNEIDDLQRLIRQREKVLKSAAKQRSTEVLADFENQMGRNIPSTMIMFGPKPQKSPMRRSPRHKSRSSRDAAKSGFLTDSRPQSPSRGTIAAMAIRLKNGATNCARWP